jgi:hypothetical protein
MALTGWLYRKKITLTGSTSGAQTNYSIPVTVNYGSGTDSGANVYCGSKCKTDFGDVRFTAADGDTLIPHWFETKTDSSSAKTWVKVPSIGSSPATVDAYVYYGNADAVSASDVKTAGLFGTDFEIAQVNDIPAINAAAKFTLPVPSGYPSQEYVHPSVVDFGVGGWNGYRYWMANTPYCETNFIYENPCILASNDNSTWVEPAGITNPVVPRPINGSSYNSDCELVYNDETNELWMYWVITMTTMKAAKSSDGVTWTNLDGGALTYGDNGTTITLSGTRTSPAVVKLGTSSWVMYATDTGGSGPWNKLFRYTSANGRTWSNETLCMIPAPLSGAGLWHMDVVYSPTLEKYILMTSDSHRGATHRGGSFWMGESENGLVWDVSPIPVMARKTTGWDSKILYRPSILYDSATDKMRVWYSAQDTSNLWWTGYTEFDYSDMLTTLAIGGYGGLIDANMQNATSVKTLDTTTVRSGSKSLKHSVRNCTYTVSNIHDANWTHFIRYITPVGAARVSAWIYDNGAATPERLILRLNGGSGTSYVGIGIAPGTSGTKYCSLNTSGNLAATSIDRTTGWHHFEVKYDKTAGANAARLYVDGTLAATLALASAINGDVYGFQIQSIQVNSSEKITYLDDIFISNYVYAEPSITAYATEEYFPDDDTAPNLTDASCTATSPTTATGVVTTDDGNGTLYFLASANATETAATIKAALSQAVTVAGEQTISLSGLDADTTYYLHFVQINGASLESDVVSTTAWATPEVPPVVYPIIHAVAGSSNPRSVTCTVTTDTPGGVIYGLLNTDPLPPQAGIITSAPTDTGSVTLAGEYTLGADELNPRTKYYWHVVHVDGDDLASNVLTIPVTTLDISIALSLSNTAPAKLQYVLVTSDMGITAAEIESLWGLT